MKKTESKTAKENKKSTSKKVTVKKDKTPSLSKYFTAQNVEMLRSQIQFADYNPRTISKEALDTLRKGIKKFGLVGGIVVNKRDGKNILVQGHQRLTVMDSLQKFKAETYENDYVVRVDVIEIDEKSEKELVILLNNPNAQGVWDYDRLKVILPEIDYTAAGLTEADLSMIGVGLENEVATVTQQLAAAAQTPMANAFAGIMEGESEGGEQSTDDGNGNDADAEADRQAKIQHMKDVKAQVQQQAAQRAEQAAAYLMLSFDNMDNMMEFLEIFNLPEQTQIIKGEEFLSMLQSE